MIILKELSYSSYNAINTYMCYILIIFFIYTVLHIYSKIIKRIHPNETYPPDFTSYLSQNMNIIIDSLLFSITKKIIQSETGIYDEYLKKTNGLVYSYAEDTSNSLNKNKNNVNIINDSFNKIYSQLNDTTTMLQDTINTVANTQNKNIENVQQIYINYQNRITSFVNDMIAMLNNLNNQINYAYISPKLETMINPMKKMYKAIRTTLINHVEFIKKFQPNFKESQIPTPTFTENSVQDVQANFVKSSTVLSTSGHI